MHLVGLDRSDPILTNYFIALHLIDITVLHLGGRAEREVLICTQKAHILLLIELVYTSLHPDIDFLDLAHAVHKVSISL